MILGVGTDIIEIERVKKAVERSPRFLTQVFTREEIAACEGKPDYVSSLAARFAAKEAVSKALGVTMWVEKWRQIEVAEQGHIPTVLLHGEIWQQAQQMGVAKIHLSLSHDKEKALAFAIAE